MEERFLQVDGLRINYRIGGAGVPILILPGWDSSSDKWQKVGEILAKNDFKVIIPDLPGFGKSDFPPQPWSVGDYLEVVVKFVERLKEDNILIRPFFLLGHSFGGRIAIKFGAVYPEKISGLILCSAAGLLSKKSLRTKFFNFLAKSGEVFFRLPIFKNFQNFARKVLYCLAGTRDYLKATPLMKETMKKVISEDLLPFLAQIKLPTLIIWGKRDKILPLSGAHLIKNKIQNSTLEILNEVGHAPNLEAPQELSQLIIQWKEKF